MSIKYLFLPLLIHLGGNVYASEKPLTTYINEQILTDTSWNNLITRSVSFYKKGDLALVNNAEFTDHYFSLDRTTAITKGGFKYAQYEEILAQYQRTWLNNSYNKLTYAQELYINLPNFRANLTKTFKEHANYAQVKPLVDLMLEQCLMSLNYLGDKPVALQVVLEGFRAYLFAGMYSYKEEETFNDLKKSYTKGNANQLYKLLTTEFNPFKAAITESLVFANAVDNIVNFRINYLNKAAEQSIAKWEEDFIKKASVSTIGVDIERFLAAVRKLHDNSKNDLEKKYYSLFKESIFTTMINTLRPSIWAYNLQFYKELTYKNINELLHTPYFLSALENNKGQEQAFADNIAQITTTLLKTLKDNCLSLQTEQYQFVKALAMKEEEFNISFAVNIRNIKQDSNKLTYSIVNLVFNEKSINYKGKTYKISVNFQPKLEDNSGTIYYQFLEGDRVIGTLPLNYKINVNQNFNINFNIEIDENNLLYKEQIAKDNIFKDLLENILFL